jgi:hypothetical protein
MLERARGGSRLRSYLRVSHPGRQRTIRRALIAFGCGLPALAILVLAAGFAAPVLESRIDVRSVSPERGAAFIAPVIHRVPFAYSVYGSDVGAPSSARLALFENGIPLGPEDASHELIRNSGQGAYSHWGKTLYFSSSDNSDPRTNGRDYSYRVSAGLKRIVERAGIVAAILGLFCFTLLRRLRTSRVPDSTVDYSRRSRLIRRASFLFVAIGAAWIAALLLVPWLQQPEKVQLGVQDVKHAGGYAYYAAVPSFASWPWRPVRDLTSTLLPGQPQMLENGVPIGRLSSGVIEVVRSGRGRFAYFDGVLAFSASDDSDPRTNGRRYVLETPAEPAPRAWILGLALIAVGVGVLVWQGGNRLGDAVFHFGPASASRAGTRGSVFTDYAVMILAALAAMAMLLLNWWNGASSHLGVVSYFPVSDAFGYYQCALSIGVSDTLNSPYFGEWCSRRALYPAMLSSLLAFSGWRSSIALLAQAAMIGLGTGLLVLAVQRAFGWVTASLCAVGMLIVAREFSLGNFMTESLGLAAGLAGLALLILSLRRREPLSWSLILGLASVSVGMALRIGAIFAVPVLAVWAFYATRTMSWRLRWRILLASAAALSLGMALQLGVVRALGGNVSNTAGNWAGLLYGLSTGSRDWSQAYRDFAHQFATSSESVVYQQIREAAISNIQAQPKVFIRSLFAAGKAFAYNLFTIGPMASLNGPLTLLFLLGVAICLFYSRHPVFALLVAVAFAEIISAPLVFDSAGHRVLVVTVAARAALASLAVGWVVAAGMRLKWPALSAAPDSSPGGDRRIRFVAGALAASLVLLAVVPGTPLAKALRFTPISPSGLCKDGHLEVATRLGSASMQLTFGEHRLPLASETLGVAVGRLELDPASRSSWWLAKLQPQPRGTTLVYAIQRAGQNPGTILPAFTAAPLDDQSGKLVSLCLQKETPPSVSLGDLDFYRVVRVHVRDE